MGRRTLWLATLAVAGTAATFSTPASAGDPVAGLLIGGGIGAAIGGPPGAAVGAVIGTLAATSDPYYYDRRGYYDRGYHGYYDRGYVASPRYYGPPPVYYGPAYYAPRIEYRSYRYAEPRRYDDRGPREERHYQRGEYR